MEISGRNIQSWAEEDKPREKLMLKGKSALSDAELIAILIRSGTRRSTAVDVAREILNISGNSLNELAQKSVADLRKIKGVGAAKAISVVSALELGRRRKGNESDDKFKVKSSADIFDLMKPHLLDLDHEQFWVILLNRSNQVIQKSIISQGGVTSTVVDAKIVFQKAIEKLATGIVLVHNHPSGNLTPSDADIKLTKKIQSGAELMDMNLIDHLIFGNKDYYSFADNSAL